mgnify:CR=1 FL=1
MSKISHTVARCLAEGTAHLAPVSETAHLDAEVLLAAVIGVTREGLIARSNEEVPPHLRERFFALIERRRLLEPISYIVGRKYFFEDSFYVDSRVFIPRPDSEIVVEEALRRFPPRSDSGILDLCCGTGCLGLSIFRFTGTHLTLADISSDALAVARINAERILPLRMKDISFIQSDLFEHIAGRFDLIVANPPYLSSSELEALTGTPGAYEPRLAFDGGTDGFSVSRRILAAAHHYLTTKGTLLLELGIRGGEFARTAETSLRFVEIVKDYADIERVAVFLAP